MLLPTICSQLELPNVVQMAVSVAAVMAVPARSDGTLTDGRMVVAHALHRLIGCFLGGVAGFLLLALPLTQFLPWLIALAAGVWTGTHIQASTRGVGYIGSQATVVYIVTLVQGWGPPSSILPGIDRFVGILCGVIILLLVSLLCGRSTRHNTRRPIPPPVETPQHRARHGPERPLHFAIGRPRKS
jgi:hypothetical protein